MIHKEIRTYGRTRGRTKNNLPFETHPPWFHQEATISYPEISYNNSANILEVGCGMGKTLIELAIKYPKKNFIGVEVYKPGIYTICKEIIKNKIENITLIENDILEVLIHMPKEYLDRVLIFFPDPWPKIKHHKRRLYRGSFFQLLNPIMKKNGIIHLATDIKDYAEEWCSYTPKNWIKIPKDEWTEIRGSTKYELRGQKLGHSITEILYKVK